jgi:hypothetical protein
MTHCCQKNLKCTHYAFGRLFEGLPEGPDPELGRGRLMPRAAEVLARSF